MATLFQLKLENALVDTNCVSLGTIQSFNATLQTAEISINYKRKVGTEFIEYPLLVDCPVIFLTGGEARLTLPVAQGDTCIVLFCDRDIDTWFDSGQITEPNSRRIHSLNDGVALVGIRSKLNPLENFNELISSLIDQSGERLSQGGDIKFSMRVANHSGWLIMDGSTVGDVGSGADYEGAEYEELFDIAKVWSPNAGTESFSGSDTVILTDMRGRGAVGADNMGGSQANVLTTSFTPNRNALGGEIGEESHLLTGEESGIQQHNHPQSGASRNPSGGGAAELYSASVDSGPTGINTDDTGHTDAIDEHNNVHPGTIGYWFVKI